MVKPATQNGEGISLLIIKGLFTGYMFENFSFNSSDKPKFREALMATILCNPLIVKCSLRLIS